MIMVGGKRLRTAGPEIHKRWFSPITVGMALLVYLFAHGIFSFGITNLQGGDEYCRAFYSYLWAKQPYFATSDHIWLAGHFYLVGILYKFLGNMKWVVIISSLFGAGMTVFFGTLLGARLWKSRMAGVFSGIFIGTEWIVLWTSCSPMSEVFFFPALLATFYFWMLAWDTPPKKEDESFSPRRDYFLLLTAVCVAFGTAFRYEMWYIGILLGIYLFIRFLYHVIDSKKRRFAWIPLSAAILIAVYPVAWLISSVIHFGSPFGFFTQGADKNQEFNLFFDFKSPLRMFFTYPWLLLVDHFWHLGLPVAGIVLVIFRKDRRVGRYLLSLLLILVVAMLITTKSGIGSNTRQRLTLFILLPLLCIGAGPLALAWESINGEKRLWIRQIITIMLIVWAGTSVIRASRIYPHAWGQNPAILGLMHRLDHEHDISRRGMDFNYIQNVNAPLYIHFNQSGGYLEYWMAVFHSKWPDRITPINNDPVFLQNLFHSEHPSTHFLIKSPRPDVDYSSVHIIEVIGPYELWGMGAPPG